MTKLLMCFLMLFACALLVVNQEYYLNRNITYFVGYGLL